MPESEMAATNVVPHCLDAFIGGGIESKTGLKRNWAKNTASFILGDPASSASEEPADVDTSDVASPWGDVLLFELDGLNGLSGPGSFSAKPVAGICCRHLGDMELHSLDPVEAIEAVDGMDFTVSIARASLRVASLSNSPLAFHRNLNRRFPSPSASA